ncbi:MAG: 3-hydroxyacyl-CoA dehydrogenase family protein [Dehalococcoidales bacterium]|nr:3-hydroxyacyl-CoA dehydrogenase family protein [Dehalococcoidales bacterium]
MDINLIDRIAIIGAGTMGIGIAQTFAQAGIMVYLSDIDQESLDRALLQIKANTDQFREFGLLDEAVSEITSRVVPVPGSSLKSILSQCRYIVEVIPEILEEKKKLFAELEDNNSTAIISSNTGSLTIAEMAQGMKNPSRLIGVHYFNPAHIIPTVEIHGGPQTSGETVETTRELMIKSGKKPAMVRKEATGFIVNRLTGALTREIGYLLDEGIVTPEDLDIAVKGSIGFRMSCLGPMETEDMIGLDTSVRVSERMFKTLNNTAEPSPLLVGKVKAGELGIKAGKGWYDYRGKSTAEVLEGNNRKLLSQLAMFYKREKQ